MQDHSYASEMMSYLTMPSILPVLQSGRAGAVSGGTSTAHTHDGGLCRTGQEGLGWGGKAWTKQVDRVCMGTLMAVLM